LAYECHDGKLKCETTTNPLKIMRTRNGKIARLPCSIRELLNQRLERAQPSPKLLDWLNALPEVQEVLQQDFDGEPVSRQNLSQWRQGGYQDWVARADLWAGIRNLYDFAEDMEEGREVEKADKVTTVLTARFADLLTRWNGECTREFEAKARALNGLCRSVTRLQRQVHWADRDAFETRRLLEKHDKKKLDALREKAVQQWMALLRVQPLAETFGGGTKGEKIARYILAMEGDRLHSKDAKLNFLPTDKFGEPEPKPGEAKSGKPTRKERMGKQARKAKRNNVAKPLEENEMGAKEAESTQDDAKPVKVCNSDLEQPKEEGLGAGLGLGLGTDEPSLPSFPSPEEAALPNLPS
jgi:hypothetical protein